MTGPEIVADQANRLLVFLLRSGTKYTVGTGDQWYFDLFDVVAALALDQEDPDIAEAIADVPVREVVDTNGVVYLMVTLEEIKASLIHLSHVPEARAYWHWFMEFIDAISRYGYYDPASGHTPPPGQELEALERREHGRDLLNALVPGMGDVAAGQRPSTAEGRKLWWYRIVDEDGHETFVNAADLPDAEEDEDAED